MPVILTAPETKPAITSVKIERLTIDVAGEIVIDIAKGYTAGSTFNISGSKSIILQDADFTELASTYPDNTKTLYDNLKTIVYNKLIAKGEISGTIV